MKALRERLPLEPNASVKLAIQELLFQWDHLNHEPERFR